MGAKSQKVATALDLLVRVADRHAGRSPSVGQSPIGKSAIGKSAIGTKPVIFICSPAGCVAAIVAPTFQFVVIGRGGGLVPVGTTEFLFEVNGPAGADFSVTCVGATIAPKAISGTLPNRGAKGARALVVA